MNAKAVATVALMTAAVVVTIKDYRKIKQYEEAHRFGISEELQLDIDAIRAAEGIVIKRIHRGDYDGRGFEPILTDLKFEQIVRRY